MEFKVELEKDEIETKIADQEDILLSFRYGGGGDCKASLADSPLAQFDLTPEDMGHAAVVA
jgi:hypothetical protein